MDLQIEDKVAIVTGSARGLGAATARRLAEEGAKVVVTDILREQAEATAAALRADGLQAHCIVADITKGTEVQRLVEETVAHFGGVHILVNNAGFPRDKYLVKMAEEDWDLVMEVRLKGAFLASKTVMPHFIAQGLGQSAEDDVERRVVEREQGHAVGHAAMHRAGPVTHSARRSRAAPRR